MADMWQLHEAPPCKVQDAFTNCQRLQLLFHITEHTLLGWTVRRWTSPLLQLNEGPGWKLGYGAASSDPASFSAVIGAEDWSLTLRRAEYDDFVQASNGAICCLLWALEGGQLLIILHSGMACRPAPAAHPLTKLTCAGACSCSAT